VLIGDGESDEGQIWEAAMSAAKYRVSNLTVILDKNRYQQTGPVHEVMPSLDPIPDKWHAFGWYVREINGHSIEEILDAFKVVQSINEEPQIIIAHTLKGKGLSPLKQTMNRKHGEALTPAQLELL
jgi:transketolase